MTQLLVGPFNRVEGDLEVTLDVVDGQVAAARVNSPLYRGFEQILHGRHPADALVIAPRICGICSVAQSTAAAYALAEALGVSMPDNGRLATNLVLATENLADHATHFYLFFAPDFARASYAGRPWHGQAAARFTATRGSAAREFLAARAAFLHMMGYLAGKWPHTLAIQPGGSTRAVELAEKVRLYAVLREFRRFLEQSLFGDALENIAGLRSDAELRAWMAARAPGSSDFRLFLEIADDLRLDGLGRSYDRFLSYGNYPMGDGARLFKPGLHDGGAKPFDASAIAEDVSHSWLMGPETPLHPSLGVTLPEADKADGYTWCKAPRIAGLACETGALARQIVDGHPLALDLLATGGGNVRSRVVARLLELAVVVPHMESWVKQLVPGEPFCNQGDFPEEGQGTGLLEAARGSLGHWLGIRKGRISSYQIIAPTTWNFSPRDAQGTPGPLEAALVGAPVRDGETTPMAVQHVVRSFDPCMVCTVH